ncbi:MAG TPA: chemotaxis protein CheA [Geobacteraceae bacterium]|nr:chemotaxis protein CheA [Geobacteraceae bacterium]
MNEQCRESFREETRELLAELETSLLELERFPKSSDAIGRVFRAMHTIKGLSGSFGFDSVSGFAHEAETVFSLVRNGTLPVDRELIDLTLRARDWISAEFAGSGGKGETERMVLADSFRRISATAIEAGTMAPASRDCADGCVPPAKRIICRIRFKPSPDALISRPDPVCLLNELRHLGECSIVAHLHQIPPLESITPEKCYTYWDILLTTDKGINAVRDVFIFIQDESEVRIDILHEDDGPSVEPAYRKLGQILVERGDLSPEDVEACLSKQKRFGEILVDEGLASPSHVESALREQKIVQEARIGSRMPDILSSVKVPSEKLDKLVDLVGELVTASARLSRITGMNDDPRFASVAEEVERLTGELRDTTLNIRMMPIGETFGKFRRVVRDLSRELGKEVEIITAGEETELDKTVIEKLNDPLVHLIRNSIDHGIEPPEVREAAGKGRQGIVVLTAAHAVDSVVLTIQDDGAGFDAEAIRSEAIGKGLIKPDTELSEKELFSLVFAPGFSTVKKVTGVSGRGVGMDVVKRSIEGLRGAIEISSRRGSGTVIKIRLPLTLAIIESLLVRIGTVSFVLPLSVVEECVEHKPTTGRETKLADVRGSLIPYIPLRERFDISDEPPEIQQIVIVKVDDDRVGFVVDTVVGEHQTVIKSLGRAYRDIRGVSGATILGDGTVALILDVAALTVTEKEIYGKCLQSSAGYSPG